MEVTEDDFLLEDTKDDCQIMKYLEGAGVHFASSKTYLYTMRKAVDGFGGVSLLLISSVHTAVFLDT